MLGACSTKPCNTASDSRATCHADRSHEAVHGEPRAVAGGRPAIPAELDDLRGHEIIGFDPTLSAVPAAKWIEQRMAGATLAVRRREMTGMVAAALSGAGLAILPCPIADDQPGLIRVTPDVLATSQLSLVYARESRLAKPVQTVIRFVAEVIQENISRIAGTTK